MCACLPKIYLKCWPQQLYTTWKYIDHMTYVKGCIFPYIHQTAAFPIAHPVVAVLWNHIQTSLINVLLSFLCCPDSSPLEQPTEPNSRAWVLISPLTQIDTAIIWAPLIADGQISARLADPPVAFVSALRLWKYRGCLTIHGPSHNMKLFTARDFIGVLIGWNQSPVCHCACQQVLGQM